MSARNIRSAVGSFAERWLIFDDPSLLRLGNISQSTMYSKSQKLQIIERAHYLHFLTFAPAAYAGYCTRLNRSVVYTAL